MERIGRVVQRDRRPSNVETSQWTSIVWIIMLLFLLLLRPFILSIRQNEVTLAGSYKSDTAIEKKGHRFDNYFVALHGVNHRSCFPLLK